MLLRYGSDGLSKRGISTRCCKELKKGEVPQAMEFAMVGTTSAHFERVEDATEYETCQLRDMDSSSAPQRFRSSACHATRGPWRTR